MSSISLDNAWLLLIAVPAIIILVVPFVFAVRKDNRNGHNIASCALHIIMAVIIAFAAAGVTVETTLTETDVFVVADVSYSSNRNLDLIDEYINDIQDNLPDNSQMGVICFGKESTMLTGMGGQFTSVKDADLTEEQISQTDIASALEYAGERFKNGVIKRIVLITDAKQTGAGDDDNLKQVVDRLTAQNVHIDAIYLDNNITGDVAEVQISGVTASQTVYSGRQSEISVSIESSCTQSAAVSLYLADDAGTPISSRDVSLTDGTNQVTFDLPSDRESGTYTYKVEVQASQDTNTYNNGWSFTQEVVGGVKVLFITGSTDDRAEAEEIFADSADTEVDYYCGDTAVPYTVADVCSYDIFVLADIDVSSLENYSMFIDSLDVAVSQLGKSLIAIGDLNLQNNTGDEALTKLESMLPVNYGNTIRQAKLYALVIDCSYSMATSGRLVNAQAAAEAIVDILNEDDWLYIIKFYSEVSSEVYNAEVGDGTEAKEFIESINTYQGTVISGGFNYILNNVAPLNFSSKNVFLITDGLYQTSDRQNVYDAVQELYDGYGITTSVIDVGLTTDHTTSAEFLDTIKTYGHGGYYQYTYGDSLSDILPTISNQVADTVVDGVAKNVTVSYRNYNDDVLSGVKSGGYIADGSYTLSYIEGYVVSSAKSSATTVLTTSYSSSSASAAKSVPLYSYWNYGNGTTSCFTSSISGDWVARWNSTGILKTFFTDVFAANTPAERVTAPYTININKDGDSYSIDISPVEIKAEAQVNVYLTDTQGNVQALTVVFDSSSYISSFSVDEVGSYVITVEYVYKDTSESYEYYADVSYLAEYDSFTLYEASLLYKIIGANGTVSESGAFKIENDESEISKSTSSLTIPLLIAAVSLYAVDIAVRKLKWNDITGLFVKVAKGGKS